MSPEKRGLIIEGGGMRGAHSCGVLMALAEKKIPEFDVVVASSAGACTAAFWVSRQFELLPEVWTRYLHDGRFISLLRLPTKRSVMDLDYLVDEIFLKTVNLDVKEIRRQKSKFFIPATDYLTGQATYFDAAEETHPLPQLLKATAALPLAYRNQVIIQGRRYIDGGASAPIPIQKAIEEGCTDITVVLTRPLGYRKKPPRISFFPRLYRDSPPLAKLFEERHLAYNDVADRIEREDFPARLTVIAPSENLPVNRLSTDLAKIKKTIALGRQDAFAALSKSQ